MIDSADSIETEFFYFILSFVIHLFQHQGFDLIPLNPILVLAAQKQFMETLAIVLKSTIKPKIK